MGGLQAVMDPRLSCLKELPRPWTRRNPHPRHRWDMLLTKLGMESLSNLSLTLCRC